MESKIIRLDEYKDKKTKQEKNNTDCTNKLKDPEKDNRKDTFNLFMRVLSTIREETY